MTKTQKIYHEDVQFLAKVISELADAAAYKDVDMALEAIKTSAFYLGISVEDRSKYFPCYHTLLELTIWKIGMFVRHIKCSSGCIYNGRLGEIISISGEVCEIEFENYPARTVTIHTYFLNPAYDA